MPSREPTQEDMLEAIRLKALADGAASNAQSVAQDAEKKRAEARRKLDDRLKGIETSRVADTETAQGVYDKALGAIDKTLKTTQDKVQAAMDAVEAHKALIQKETGAIIDLAGSGSRSRSTHL